jgi:hypothetical protein
MDFLFKGILKSQADLREFKRFNKIGNGHDWSISLTKQDAIIFEARRDVYIYGIGIYGADDDKKHDFKIKYKWIIQRTPNGDTAEESQWFEESSSTLEPSQMIQNRYFKYEFSSLPKPFSASQPKGISVKKGQSFNFVICTEFDHKGRSYCTKGDDRVASDSDDFKIHESSLSKNGGGLTSGLIPSIYYTYA